MYFRQSLFIATIFGLFTFSGLSSAGEAVSNKVFQYHFANGSLGWSADFADYPAGQEEFYELAYDFAKLPSYLVKNRFALRLNGNNHSDDLCMFLRKKVTGLKPNTKYQVRFAVTIASNAPKDAIGVGGAPGESVVVKTGVSLIRPVAEPDPDNRRLNIDIGDLVTGGADAMVIGHLGVDTPVEAPKYRFKTLNNHDKPFSFRSDETGNAWLFFATDSGYESTSRVYVVAYKARFTENL